jgi:NADH-quinone oxidoreductase subunit A
MTSEWIYIGIFLLIAGIFPGAAILIAYFLAPHKPSTIKSKIYECGIETHGETRVPFKVQYYNYALAFLIFDVEVVFLFPWAIAFDQLTIFGVLEGILFIVILLAALFNIWGKGALEWV